MIQALWIITETGQCIFSHKYVKLDIEDQLISGLLTAFNAFSTESGIGGIQQIGGKDNQFVYGSSGKFLIAALADKRDNAKLVEKLMNKISQTFQNKYAIFLTNDVMYTDLNVFNGFEVDINHILFPKIYRRGTGSTFFATLITLAMTTGILFLLLDIIAQTKSTFVIFLAFIPGLFIGSIVAGKNSYALISSLLGITPIVAFSTYYIVIDMTLSLNNKIFTSILMGEQFLTIAILCAILGGGIIERKRLFPFPKGVERVQPSFGNLYTNYTQQSENDLQMNPQQESDQQQNYYQQQQKE